MKWTRTEYNILNSVDDKLEVVRVKGITTEQDGYKLGIHNAGGIWVLTDLTTGARLGIKGMLQAMDTQRALKIFTAEHWEDLTALIDDYYELVPDKIAECKALVAN